MSASPTRTTTRPDHGERRGPTILCVHQGAELYGSDRTFAWSLEAIKRHCPDCHVVAVLPCDGPLVDLVSSTADEIHQRDLWVLRRSDLRRRPWRLFALPAAVLRARRAMRDADYVYINTVVVADHLLASRLVRTRCCLHLHELPPSRIGRAVFSLLIRLGRTDLVFNSRATRDAFHLPHRDVADVVHNGVPDRAGIGPLVPPAAGEPLNVLLPGRFNGWKGQGTLIDAVATLPRSTRERLEVRIVGGVFADQHHFRDELVAAVTARGLEGVVSIEPFADDPTELYRWAHVVVQPSLLPEPFGLVAVEGMAAGRAVVVSDLGGPREVVVDGTSGLVFPAGDATALADRLAALVEDPELLVALGRGGRERYLEAFTLEGYQDRLWNCIARGLRPARPGAPDP